MLMKRQYADWFGLAGLNDEPDAAACWERLREYPERSQPCDMLMVIPTRLATELNGSGGLLTGVSTTLSFYSRIYGMEWPAGHNVNLHRHAANGLTLRLDSPWYPPSGEVVAGISALFECEVRHTYSEPVSGLSGYDCYDLGAHVDGHWGCRWTLYSPRRRCIWSVVNRRILNRRRLVTAKSVDNRFLTI